MRILKITLEDADLKLKATKWFPLEPLFQMKGQDIAMGLHTIVNELIKELDNPTPVAPAAAVASAATDKPAPGKAPASVKTRFKKQVANTAPAA